MQLLHAEEMKAWDEFTIQHEPITSLNLMERAARACTNWMLKHYQPGSSFCFFCGSGNNGGDGLAIARMLHEHGYAVEVYMAVSNGKGSEDFEKNRERISALPVPRHRMEEGFTFPEISPQTIVIDALFGTGLNRPIDGWIKDFIRALNEWGGDVISIDIPSGMLINASSAALTRVKATTTLSFQVTKLPFLLPENGFHTGKVVVLDIGLSPSFPGLLSPSYKITEPSMVASLLPNRDAFAHKGTFGHAVLIAGSPGMMGAAVLSAKACTRSGVGKLTVVCPWEERSIVQTAVPEAMVSPLSIDSISEKINPQHIQSIGIGPGLGTAQSSFQYFEKILRYASQPIVIDADALNILAQNKYLWSKIPRHSILTPHPGEFARLTDKNLNNYQAIERALLLAKEQEVYIILKGRYSFIATPEGKGYFNPTGNPGMATGGSGDVLTGLLTGLLAQGISSFAACVVGVYVHGLAGDIAAADGSDIAMNAGDIVAALQQAFSTVSAGY